MVCTEFEGCLEGKVPQKPGTDHTTNASPTLRPVIVLRHGQVRWTVVCSNGNPKAEEFLCGYLYTYSWGLIRNQEGKNTTYCEFRIFPVMSLRKGHRKKKNLNVHKLFLFPGKKLVHLQKLAKEIVWIVTIYFYKDRKRSQRESRAISREGNF